MNAGALLILVIILAVIVFMYGTQLQDLVNNATNAYTNAITNAAVKPIAKPGQSVCTLDIGFHATLTGSFLQITQQVNIPNGAYKTSWIACQSSYVKNSLIPMWDQFIFNGQTLDFLSGGLGSGGTYHFNAVLIADDGTRLTPITNPFTKTFKDTLTIDNQNFDISYTFLHVPRQHYILQVSSPEIGIGALDQGSIYYQQINP